MGDADLFPIFEARALLETMPGLLTAANSGLIGIGCPGQPIIVDAKWRLDAAQVSIGDVTLGAVAKTDL